MPRASIPMLLLPFLLLAHLATALPLSSSSLLLRRQTATTTGEEDTVHRQPIELRNLTWTSERGAILLNGRQFHLKGVNWFGMETDTRAPHGLWAVPLKDVIDFLADNKVRRGSAYK